MISERANIGGIQMLDTIRVIGFVGKSTVTLVCIFRSKERVQVFSNYRENRLNWIDLLNRNFEGCLGMLNRIVLDLNGPGSEVGGF